MALVNNETVIILDGATQQIAGPLKAKSLRWVSKAASAGDDIELVEDSNHDTSAVIWESVAAGANYVESDSNGGQGFDFRNGLRVKTLDSGKLYVYL